MITTLLVFVCICLSLGQTYVPTFQVKKKPTTKLDEIDWMRGIIDSLRSGATPAEALSYSNIEIIPTAISKLNQPMELASAIAVDASKSNSLLLKALAACWQVSQHYGAPLAPALQSALDAQLDRIAIADEIRSQLAGPKTAAVTLALLPVATLLMAQSLGIPAIYWLFTSWIGITVFVLGFSLLFLGTFFMLRLTNSIEQELRL